MEFLVLIGLGALLALFGWVSLAGGQAEQQRLSLPVTPCGGPLEADLNVRVVGRIHAKELITAPLSGVDCVAYTVTLSFLDPDALHRERHPTGLHLKRLRPHRLAASSITSKHSARNVRVVDASGECYVFLEGAIIHFQKQRSEALGLMASPEATRLCNSMLPQSSLEPQRLVEARLDPNEEVMVIGRVEARTGAISGGDHEPGASEARVPPVEVWAGGVESARSQTRAADGMGIALVVGGILLVVSGVALALFS